MIGQSWAGTFASEADYARLERESGEMVKYVVDPSLSGPEFVYEPSTGTLWLSAGSERARQAEIKKRGRRLCRGHGKRNPAECN